MDLSRFTAQQRDVIVAGDGPLSILAGPGSGKTTTLAGRIAHLVSERDIPPTSILAITFTTAAAATLRNRLETVLGSAATRVDIRTFHSFGLRVIRTWSEELGFGHLPPAVYGREETRILLRKAATSIGLAVAPDRSTGDSDPWLLSVARLEHWLERFRLCGSTAEEPDALHQEVLRELAAAYERQLQSNGAVDYAAMLLLPLRLFEAEPRAGATLQDAYRYVLVDETQDTCRLQYRLVQHVVAQRRNLAVVGDPLQSVYSFRGADPTLLESFGVDYPDARRYVLDQNHRSTATIVTLANAIAAPLASRPNSWTANPAGPAARLYRADDELDEARYIADEVARLLAGGHITEPGQAAVLFRTNAQAPVIADALRSHGLPVQLRADQDVFARPEIRDLLAYLRLAHNPNDTPALARILDTPPRGLRLVERAFRRKPVPLADLAESAHGRGGAAARRSVEELVSMLADIHAAAADSASVRALELVLERTNYAVWLTNQQDGPERLQNVEHLHALLEHTSAPDLGTWLADLHLGETDAAPDQRCVSLLTVHAAKGREWPVVFVTGVEEGLLPHVRPPLSGQPEPSDDEERRLTYVALSRCQVLLYLTYCRTRRPVLDGQPGRPEPQQPSRYLRGLPMDLVARVA
ncbi:MAG: ATP-dependent helicase [Chloroflexi bacterium]|nr:ATP-dependent helicase [Chloroflexota bacterium]